MRQELLVLTQDDLASISNRGTLKRALKEVTAGKVTAKIEEEEDGKIHFEWSDDISCTLGSGDTVAEMACSCPATNICRHRIRSVLAYQAWAKANQPDPGEAQETADGEQDELHPPAEAHAVLSPWDPGAFSEDDIKEHFSAARIRAAKKLFDAGLVVELIRSKKPMAHFHKLGHTLRFQVPGDLRYTRCDCAEEAPCVHVPCAIWAARLLKEEHASGFVTTAEQKSDTFERAESLLVEVEEELASLLQHGFTGTPPSAFVRFEQLESQLQGLAYVWPASILSDIRQQYEYYQEHNARFDPTKIAELVGEFLIRRDALQQKELPIPRLFVQGSAQNSKTKLGQTRFVGLGCVVTRQKRSVNIQAILQDVKTGTLVALGKEFLDPETGEGVAFNTLASKHVFKDRSLESVGTGQLVIKQANLHPDHHIDLGRSPASVYPQPFQWEQLSAPINVEGFDEVRSRLQALPPASLRPRRIGEDFHVIPIDRVENASFSVRDQAVTAVLIDNQGNEAILVHPYTSRNRLGTERLLSKMKNEPKKICFVAGRVHIGAHGLTIHPTALVFEDKPDKRYMVQPWVDSFDDRKAEDSALGNARATLDPIEQFGSELIHALGELYLVGLRHTDISTHKTWNRLQEFGLKLGMHDAMGSITDLCNVLDPEVSINPSSIQLLQTQSVFETNVMAKMLQELS